MIRKTTACEFDSGDSSHEQLLQNCRKGCKISRIVHATNSTEGAIWYRLLTLEALGTVRATSKWDPTTYFLSDIEEQPE